MSRATVLLLALVCLIATASGARAQHGHLLCNVGDSLAATCTQAERVAKDALDSLAMETARVTMRYTDRREAMSDGYRRIGTDFPGMGEHWLHSGALMTGNVDASRPTLLSYANLSGRATLVGVGFVVTTRSDSAAPDVPGWPDHWHEHSGLLGDESGAAVGTPRGGERKANATRVWVLHVWTALANPAGPYASDNWALPFARVGVASPMRVDYETGRAFSLAVGGRRYLEAVLTDSRLLHDRNTVGVRAALDAATIAAEQISTRVQATGVVSTVDTRELRDVWRVLADRLRVLCGPAVDVLLAPPHGH